MKVTASIAVVFALLVSSTFALAVDQGQLAQQWRELSGQQLITLDHRDDADATAPRYFEDIDGWLTAPGENPDLLWQHEAGMAIQRFSGDPGRRPLSLATFVDTGRSDTVIMVRVTLAIDGPSSRQMQVRWDGKILATFDTASDTQTERTFYTVIRPPVSAGVQ